MKMVTYSDGEAIQTLLIHKADLETSRVNLQEVGYRIIQEEEIAEGKGDEDDS